MRTEKGGDRTVISDHMLNDKDRSVLLEFKSGFIKVSGNKVKRKTSAMSDYEFERPQKRTDGSKDDKYRF